MANPQQAIPFAGLHSSDETDEMPDWYRTKLGLEPHEMRDVPTLVDAVMYLPEAISLKAGYYDPEIDEWVEVDSHQSVVNPSWLGNEFGSTGRTDACWTFRTDSYEPVTPLEMYGPFIDACRERGLENVYGQIRTYRDGGDITIDFALPDYVVGDTEEYVMGLSSGYSHYGDTALWTEVIAFDVGTGTEMRHLSDRLSRNHVGNAPRKTAKYHEQALKAAERASDTLWNVITEAQNYVVPFEEMPYDVNGFYEGLRIPQYIAEEAAVQLGGEGTTNAPQGATAWAIYEALATAITSEFDGKDGKMLRKHNRRANEILFSPPAAESRVINYWRSTLAKQESLTQQMQEQKVAMGERYDSAQEAVEFYETTKDTMKQIVKEATA